MGQKGKIADESKYFVDTLAEIMQRMEFDPSVDFPSVGTFGDGMPNDIFTRASVETSFIKYIEMDAGERRPILLLLFPSRLPGIYISSTAIPTQFIEIALGKIRHYLHDQLNLQYMHVKLSDKLRSSEPAIESRIQSILRNGKEVLEMVRRPSEFDFRFFASLTGFLLRELVDTFEHKPGHADLCRAAYIIGHLIIYYRGTVKADIDLSIAIKGIERAFGRRPYIYTIEQIAVLKSENGLPYGDIVPPASIRRFIASRTKPGPDRAEPQLFGFKTTDEQQYYIARRSIPTFLVLERNRIATEVENAMIEDWHKCIERYDEPTCMHNETEFQKEVVRTLRNTHPHFESLLNYRLLKSIADDVAFPAEEREQVRQFLDPYQNKMRPIMEILHINRRQIAARALVLSPFWKRFGPLKLLHRIARRFAEWRKQRNTQSQKPDKKRTKLYITSSDAPPASESLDRFQEMAQTISGGTGDVDSFMHSLTDRWNTLLETQARRKLERDLDTLIRDYAHRMLQTYRNMRGINMDAISEWSDILARSSMLSAIADKRSLRTYIKLKIIEQLRRGMVTARGRPI